jgi:hypothetical protein
VLDDDGVGPNLDLFDDQPDHALPIGHPEGLRGIMELREKAFEVLGERHVRVGVEELGLQGGELRLDGRLALAQGRHPRPELVERDQLLLVGFDQARHRGPDPGEFLGRDVALDVANVVGAQLGEPAINLGPDQRGMGEQLNDLLPDERLHHVLPDRAIGAAPALGEAVGVGPRTAIVAERVTRAPRGAAVEGVAAQLTDQQAL